MRIKFETIKGSWRMAVMAILISAACLITYYAHAVLGTCVVFTHFFYIPVILASLWWKRKGLVVAIFLAAWLIFSHIFVAGHVGSINAYLRALMFISISFVVAMLSERIEKTKGAQWESEEKYRNIIENIQDVFYRADLEGNLVMVSPSGAKTLGYDSVEDMLGLNIAKTFYAVREERDEFLKILERKGVVNGYEITLKKKDGTLVPAWVSTHFYFDKSGNPLGVEGLISDITERKASEEVLRESEESLRAIFETAQDGIFIKDRALKYTRVNPAMAKLLDVPDLKLIGRTDHDFFGKEAREHIRKVDARVLGGEIVEEEYTKQVKGSPLAFHVIKVPMRDRFGEIIGLCGITRDITERKALEGQLVQEQKLASVGQLAAGIAHEINTPIQYVGDNTRFFQASFTDLFNVLEKYHHLLETTKAGSVPPELVAEMEKALEEADVAFLSEEIPTAMKQSLEGIDSVTRIVQAMRAFAHPGVSEKTPIDLNKAIESTITVARNEWKYAAEMETDFDADLLLVHCLPGEFNQVILNIILNAAHAIADVVGDGSKGKGIIAVSTRREGNWAEIRIRDTGTGIPEAVRSKVFDPFFTTKEVGKGTGQGLAIAHNVVVEKHGGTITFETETGKGTTFIIRLPIEDKST